MNAALFAKMLSDPSLTDLKKLHYKYPQVDLSEFIGLLNTGFYRDLPLKSFRGDSLVFLAHTAQVHFSAARILLTPLNSTRLYGTRAMEDEIAASFTIENIDFSRESVRRIMAGYAPEDKSEAQIYGMKQGLDFISDPAHSINEENLFHLYELAVGNQLPDEDRLLPGRRYRHDAVYVMGDTLAHTGISWKLLDERMAELIAFIQSDAPMNDLLKAAVIHFYIGYLHPYFDGNGRLARLLHLWYLAQKGYSSALYIPFSEYINKSRGAYYRAFTLIEDNERISGVLDVTPFLLYFIQNVYHKLDGALPAPDTLSAFERMRAQGLVTEKEAALWRFVLSAYGDADFSTKQLEKDFGDAAYATIRSFVMKFAELGLLSRVPCGRYSKYRISR